MTNDVAVRDQAIAIFDEVGDDLQAMLPATIPVERFRGTFLTAVANNPNILTCDKRSIQTALMKCADDNLRPDGREAAIVPFNTRIKQDGKDVWVTIAQYMPMVQGIRKRALELGGVRIIDSECVHENDFFDQEAGDNPRIEHKRAPLGQPRGEIVGAYAIFKDDDGRILHREVMSREDIEAARRVSRAKEGPGWTNFFGEFARKTVVRRGSKSVPTLPDRLRQIIERDDDYVDFDQAPAQRTIDHNPLKEPARQIESKSEAQSGQAVGKTSPAAKGDEPTASAKPAENSAGGAGDSAKSDGRPQESSPSSSPRTAMDGDGGGGDAGSQERIPAQVWKDYDSALARMASVESVNKAHDVFWKERKLRMGKSDMDLGLDIKNAHLARVEGKVPADVTANNVAEWIERDTGSA